jgi:hypothetical protein
MMQQMPWVGGAPMTHFIGDRHKMIRLAQHCGEVPVSGIVVEVDSHSWLRLDVGGHMRRLVQSSGADIIEHRLALLVEQGPIASAVVDGFQHGLDRDIEVAGDFLGRSRPGAYGLAVKYLGLILRSFRNCTLGAPKVQSERTACIVTATGEHPAAS